MAKSDHRASHQSVNGIFVHHAEAVVGSREPYGPPGFRGLFSNYYLTVCSLFSALGGFLFGYELDPRRSPKGDICADVGSARESSPSFSSCLSSLTDLNVSPKRLQGQGSGKAY